MTQTDHYGNLVSGPPDALDGINAFILGFLRYRPEMVGVMETAETHPDSLLSQVYAGLVWMFLESPEAPERARYFIERAQGLKIGTQREWAGLRALELWADGEVPRCIDHLEKTICDHPRDLVLVKLAQYHHFNRGDAPGLLRAVTLAQKANPDVAEVHSMLAFGYEQCHLIDRAEAAAHRAMDIDETDPWAHHALAHVHLSRGTIDAGADFLARVSPMWDGLNSFMYTHNWWHLALFRLSRGEFEAALSIYDNHVWGREKTYSQDQVGAASLLARLEIAGVPVGDRWRDVADHIAIRGPDTTYPFLTMQYLYALARADRAEADSLLDAVAIRAKDGPDASVWADVALPACRGLVAHARNNWAEAARGLGAALPRMAETGGSHAQRDLFGQLHLDALVKAKRISEAQQRLEMRRGVEPDGVPLNRVLARVYQEAGLDELAVEADRRADLRLAALN